MNLEKFRSLKTTRSTKLNPNIKFSYKLSKDKIQLLKMSMNNRLEN